MIIAKLIEGDSFACFASLVTLTSGEVTDGVQTLIRSRAIRRIDLDPMSGVQTTAGGHSGFDTIQKSGNCVFSFVVPTTRPIMSAFLGVVTLGVIQKRMSVRPTMTDFVFGQNVKRTTDDSCAVFVDAKLNQIVAVRE